MLKTQFARRDGLYLLLLGSFVFILLGAALERAAPAPMLDFREVYYPARCLLQHCDPYQQSELSRVYQAEGVFGSQDSALDRLTVTRYLYLPPTFSLTLPFALLPWVPAEVLWTVLTVGGLIFASYLCWNVGANHAPVLCGLLVGFFLANSEILVIKGMCAGIAICLCVVAVWCFVGEKFVAAGILCLALSLAVKPQDTGLVWLFLLLAGGVYRRRALQTLLVTAAVCLPTVLWVWLVAPHWIQEQKANMAVYFVHGGINDPGPASMGGHGLGMVISLQTVFSMFRDDAGFYNPAAWLVCLPLLLVWGIVTLRSRIGPERAWLALAAISALSMLPVYHRVYDAELLLLSVPACAILWAEGGLIGWLAVLVTTGAFLLTGGLSWVVILGLLSYLHPRMGLANTLMLDAQVLPTPLILLAMSIFYLWVYMRRADVSRPEEATA